MLNERRDKRQRLRQSYPHTGKDENGETEGIQDFRYETCKNDRKFTGSPEKQIGIFADVVRILYICKRKDL